MSRRKRREGETQSAWGGTTAGMHVSAAAFLFSNHPHFFSLLSSVLLCFHFSIIFLDVPFSAFCGLCVCLLFLQRRS